MVDAALNTVPYKSILILHALRQVAYKCLNRGIILNAESRPVSVTFHNGSVWEEATYRSIYPASGGKSPRPICFFFFSLKQIVSIPEREEMILISQRVRRKNVFGHVLGIGVQ